MVDITAIPTSLSGIKCPHCQSIKHKKNGKEKGNQKYKCKECGKHYRNTTGSCIHRLHKKRHIEKYLQCMNDGLTLRKAAFETGISLKTSFMWRHRLLASIHKKKEPKLHPRTITFTHFLPYSEKGSRTASASSHKLHHQKVQNILQADQSGRVRINIHDANSRYSLNNLLNINETSTYLPHKSMPKIIKPVLSKANNDEKAMCADIQNMLNAWMTKFHGVATKYLHHYWAWYEQANDFQLTQNFKRQLLETYLATK